jgi:hypothetical protein
MDKHWDKQYRDGGSISSDRRFTEWDFNKLMASDKFRAVWSGNLWEIIEEGRTTVLGKFNPKTKLLYISGDKNMDNFLVVWMTENGFVNSDEYAILANGGGVERIDLFDKVIKGKHKMPINISDLYDKVIEKYMQEHNVSRSDAMKVIPINSLTEQKVFFANGGGVERIDLFEDYENIPKNVQTILDIYAEKFGDDFGNMDYKDMADMHNEIYAVGYTFDSYLDNQPYGLRPIGVALNELKGYEDMGEEYANGGGVGGGISKKSVISELKKLGYSNDNAEEIIEKHIDIYEINFDDKDTNARGIALAIDEQENQQDDYANGGGIKGKELWFSPYGEVKAEKRGTAKDFIEKNLAKSFGAEYMELVGEDEKDYIYELNGNPMMIAAKTAILQEETDLDIETYGRKKRVHIPKKSIDQTSVQLRYPLITPFKNGGGVGDLKRAVDFGKKFIKEHPEHKANVLDFFELMKDEISEGSSVDGEINSFITSCYDLIREYKNGGSVIKTYRVTKENSNYDVVYTKDYDNLKDALADSSIPHKEGGNSLVRGYDKNDKFVNVFDRRSHWGQYANGGGVDYYDTRWAEMEAYSPYTSRAEYENKKEYEELAFASKTFSKTSEILVRENLNNGEICMCKLTKILGHEPNYPIQIVGSLKLEKCFMKRFYKLA